MIFVGVFRNFHFQITSDCSKLSFSPKPFWKIQCKPLWGVNLTDVNSRVFYWGLSPGQNFGLPINFSADFSTCWYFFICWELTSSLACNGILPLRNEHNLSVIKLMWLLKFHCHTNALPYTCLLKACAVFGFARVCALRYTKRDDDDSVEWQYVNMSTNNCTWTNTCRR